MTTLENIQNTNYEYVTELTFNQNHLDAQTLCNIFLEAALQSQTTTSPQADILRMEEKDNMRIVVFSNSIAHSNMMDNFNRLVAERMPQQVQNDVGFETNQYTKSSPKTLAA